MQLMLLLKKKYCSVRETLRRPGGMADALSIASDLGFSVPQDDVQNLGNAFQLKQNKPFPTEYLRQL